MSLAFFTAASRPVADVQSYLEESASSPLKFSPKSGEVTRIFFPYQSIMGVDPATGQTVETGRGILSYSMYIHDLKPNANKYGLAPCLKLDQPIKDEQGNVINSGVCPFCNRAEDAADIVKYRLEMFKEQLTAQGVTGEDLEKKLDTQGRDYNSEQKISYAKKKIYILVAKFVLNSKNEPEIDTDTGLPAYKLQVMRLSTKQLEEMQKSVDQLAMVYKAKGINVQLAGCEMSVTYGTSTNQRNVVGQAKFGVCPPDASLVGVYQGLLNNIQQAALSFNWEEITKPYPEFKGMADTIAVKKAEDIMKMWDTYQEELAKGNKNAVYAEYGVRAASFPPITGQQGMGQPPLPNYGGQQGALPSFGGPGVPNFNNQQNTQTYGNNGGYNAQQNAPQNNQQNGQAYGNNGGFNNGTNGMNPGGVGSFGVEQQSVPNNMQNGNVQQGAPVQQNTQQEMNQQGAPVQQNTQQMGNPQVGNFNSQPWDSLPNGVQ